MKLFCKCKVLHLYLYYGPKYSTTATTIHIRVGKDDIKGTFLVHPMEIRVG